MHDLFPVLFLPLVALAALAFSVWRNRGRSKNTEAPSPAPVVVPDCHFQPWCGCTNVCRKSVDPAQ